MKKLLLLSTLVLLFASMAFAQVSVNPDTIRTIVDISEPDIAAHGKAKNNALQVKTYQWVRTDVSITDGWLSAVCDKNLCYLPTVTSEQFVLGPGEEGTLDVHVYPDAIEGSALIEVKVTDVNNANNTATAVYIFSMETATSTSEAILGNFRVYPNPNSGVFMMTGTEAAGQVLIRNLAGQEMKRAAVNAGSVYDISELPKGTYMVQLLSKDLQVLATKLVNKL